MIIDPDPDRHERRDYEDERRYLGKLAKLDVNGMSVFVKVVSMGKRSGHLILTVEPVSGYGTLRVDPNRVMMLSEEDLRRHELAEKTLRRDVECADTLSILGSLEPSGFVDRTKSDPISLDISPANGGMSGNRGGWDEGQAPEGQTRRQRTDARSDRGRPARALERTAEDGVGVAVTAR